MVAALNVEHGVRILALVLEQESQSLGGVNGGAAAEADNNIGDLVTNLLCHSDDGFNRGIFNDVVQNGVFYAGSVKYCFHVLKRVVTAAFGKLAGDYDCLLAVGGKNICVISDAVLAKEHCGVGVVLKCLHDFSPLYVFQMMFQRERAISYAEATAVRIFPMPEQSPTL